MTAPVIYSITVSSSITPAEPMPPLPEIPQGSLVIVEGRAPATRRFTICTVRPLQLLPSTIRARVVVSSHNRQWTEGKLRIERARPDNINPNIAQKHRRPMPIYPSPPDIEGARTIPYTMPAHGVQ